MHGTEITECNTKKPSESTVENNSADNTQTVPWQPPISTDKRTTTHPVTTATFPPSVNLRIVGVILDTIPPSKATALRSLVETGVVVASDDPSSWTGTFEVVRSAPASV